MFAVVSNGGRQFLMKEGNFYKVDLLAGEIGSEVAYDEVLLLSDQSGSTVGEDVAKKKVTLEILDHVKDKKVNIIKFKRRKHHMKRMGHRQGYTIVKVKSIK